MQHKSICFTNNLLRRIATAVQSLHCANNLIYQELLIKRKYFSDADERLYADLRESKGYIGELQKLRWEGSKIVLKVNFKAALPKKVRLKVWGYLQGKCLYLLTKPGLKEQKNTGTES